jgi:hypothetical protein
MKYIDAARKTIVNNANLIVSCEIRVLYSLEFILEFIIVITSNFGVYTFYRMQIYKKSRKLLLFDINYYLILTLFNFRINLNFRIILVLGSYTI